MKTMRTTTTILVVVTALFFVPSSALAQTAPPMGTAALFGVLGHSGVTGSTGSGTAVSGDVGSSPTPAVTNFPPSSVSSGFVLHLTNDATVQQAHTDAIAAYNSLVAQGTGTPLAAQLNGAVLTSGIYSFTSSADLAATGTLTLNGPGVFVFNVGSTLTMNVLSSVVGTANPCNIYWRVGTSATLNGNNFWGTVIADTSITLGGGNVSGRLLAGTGATGAVTMPGSGGNTVGGCSAPPPLIPPTIAKAFNPISVNTNNTSVLTITITNPNASAVTGAAFTDTYPANLVNTASANGATTCAGGIVTAANGGTSVALSGGTIPASGSCRVTVNVTSTTAGGYANTIAVGALSTSAGANTAAASATLTVTTPPCPTITLAPATLPNGTASVAYSQTITATGVTAPYGFAVTGGDLPAGLTLTSAGVLSGTPTTAGASTFTIRGTDANVCFAGVAYTVNIAVPVPTMPLLGIALLVAVLLSLGCLGLRRRKAAR